MATQDAKIDNLLETQFSAGRLYAAISSRPGQCGRADGYILEGRELEVRIDAAVASLTMISDTACLYSFTLGSFGPASKSTLTTREQCLSGGSSLLLLVAWMCSIDIAVKDTVRMKSGDVILT